MGKFVFVCDIGKLMEDEKGDWEYGCLAVGHKQPFWPQKLWVQVLPQPVCYSWNRVGIFFFCLFICLFWFSLKKNKNKKKKKKKKSDLFDLNQIFFPIEINLLIYLVIFLSNHLKPLEVNHTPSSSAQCLRVANSNYAIKIKQIYIQMKNIRGVKSWINCVKIRGKSSTFTWWNLG